MAVIIIIAIIIIALIIVNIRVVQQARAFVIERLGAYKETWNVGLHVKMPFIDRVAKIVSAGRLASRPRDRYLEHEWRVACLGEHLKPDRRDEVPHVLEAQIHRGTPGGRAGADLAGACRRLALQ